MDNNQLIIVKCVKCYVVGYYGGLWKIVFVDFVMVMMVFFLVFWLLFLVILEQKKVIFGYFQDFIGFSESVSFYVIDFGGMLMLVLDKIFNLQVQVQLDFNESWISFEQDYQVNVDQVENFVEQVE